MILSGTQSLEESEMDELNKYLQSKRSDDVSDICKCIGDGDAKIVMKPAIQTSLYTAPSIDKVNGGKRLSIFVKNPSKNVSQQGYTSKLVAVPWMGGVV